MAKLTSVIGISAQGILVMWALFGSSTVFAQASTSAQTADHAAVDQAGQTGALEEVVVTARRRSERLQDVPVAITALNPQDLENAQVTTGRQLVQFVPSLNVGTGNQRDFQRFTLRGQGVTLGAGEGVAAYVNEAPLPQFAAGGPGLYLDLANVQVLNGPQGTLFGRNTTGGAVLITPAPPVDQDLGYIQTGYGNYNNREFTGMVNWAAIPGLLDIRLAGELRRRDGFTQSVITGAKYDDMNYQTYRASFLLTPSSHVQNSLVLSYNRNDTDGTGFQTTDVNPTGIAATLYGYLAPTPLALSLAGRYSFGPTGPQGLGTYLAEQQALGPRKTLATAPSYFFEEDIRGVNTTTVDLSSDISWKNIVSFDRERIDSGFDVDGSPLPIIQWNKGPLLGNSSGNGVSRNDYFTEEMQFAGKSLADRLQWVGGVFYEHYTPYGGAQGNDQIIFGNLQQQIYAETSSTKAAFAQATLDLGVFTPALNGLRVTTGYRYTWDQIIHSQDLSATGNDTCQYEVGVFPDCNATFHASSSAPTWLVDLDYKFNPDTLGYFKVSTGYKSGGFNSGINPALGSAASFGPEHVRDYEGGVKTSWTLADVPFRSDIALFHDVYNDMQRNESSLLPGSNPPTLVNIVTNAGAAKIDGIEVQLDAKISAFDVSFNYSWLHARYTDFVLIQPPLTPPTGTSLDGVALPYAPTNKAGIAVTYHLPLDSKLGQVRTDIAANFQSHYRWGDLDQPGNILGGYGLINMGADWDHVAGSPIRLQFFVTNLLNNASKAGSMAYYYALGQVSASYIEPRMYGFRIRYSFGGG